MERDDSFPQTKYLRVRLVIWVGRCCTWICTALRKEAIDEPARAQSLVRFTSVNTVHHTREKQVRAESFE